MSKWLSVLILLFTSHAMADEIYTGFFSNKAISGYDSVAYFTEGKPVEGKEAFTTTYKGAEWLFASQDNLDKFVADPEAYAPQFGGYCAWAVSAKNDLAPGEPDQWAIVDGKLYLNYDADIKALWDKDRSKHIAQANTNWPSIEK
ncbi:YHS domain-containing protein [Vibrio sp.]|nr:YHS domain-containing protein [Vibrio sp.]